MGLKYTNIWKNLVLFNFEMFESQFNSYIQRPPDKLGHIGYFLISSTVKILVL